MDTVYSLKENSYFEIFNFKKSMINESTVQMNQILFLIEGKCRIESDTYPAVEMNDNEAIFLPFGSHYKNTMLDESHLIIICLDPFQRIHQSYSIEVLYRSCKKMDFSVDAGVLKLNDIIKLYLKTFSYYIESGIEMNQLFYDLKIKELLVLLHSYYSTEQLCEFFKPILNNDYAFASQIMNNWVRVKSAKELAILTNYCETAFNKKFKKVFGITPYKWLNEKRSSKIFYEITNTRVPIKQIAEEYGFNSLQHFNEYCIRNFRSSPGQIRKKTDLVN